METQQLIDMVAPALRGLCAKGDILPTVRYQETNPEGASVRCEIPTDGDAPAIVEALRKSLNGETPAVVEVPEVGFFCIRQKKSVPGRVQGKVAVVTGAAQGFGLEIAQGFAAEGAAVVLADINLEGARKAADQICDQFGHDKAMAVSVNVMDSASIGEAIHEIVKTFGGFDVFVANAGVLKADSVKTLTEKDFDFVTGVNYKGYFFCVQKAAPVMAVQRLANPDYWSDIIQINSKSGLEGSNKNGAYAGSKFGGLGLTQSFAMELVTDGIKVNSICPGNFFDGPLWSDPENGLFVQYLRTGKVPGAKTLEDVKHFYEAKVLMNRGCTTPDVMKAVFYLMEQCYETGQALPVTGGQVMLK